MQLIQEPIYNKKSFLQGERGCHTKLKIGTIRASNKLYKQNHHQKIAESR
jgi:hypothetical protein